MTAIDSTTTTNSSSVASTENKSAENKKTTEQKPDLEKKNASAEQKTDNMDSAAVTNETAKADQEPPTAVSTNGGTETVDVAAAPAAAVADDEKSTETTSDANEKSGEPKNEQLVVVGDVGDGGDLGVEACMHLVQGKRHFLVQDFYPAVEALQKACELMAAHHGSDRAAECAEPLLYYGKALLELHRKESGALNGMDGAGPEEEEEESSEEGEEDEEGDEDGDDEDSKDDDGSEKAASGGGDKARGKSDLEEDLEKPEPALKDAKLEKADAEAAAAAAAAAGSSKAASGDDKTTSTSTTTKDDGAATNKQSSDFKADAEATAVADEDDVSNLQVAFEVLDLAKQIFKREAEKDAQLYLKAADCLLTLGEVGLESDTYEQAIDDFEECLRIQQEMLPRDSREMAETNYQLGLTHSFVNKFEESASYFADAVEILKLKVANLRQEIDAIKAKGGERGSLDDDPVWRAERDIEDIEGLLPEIQAKLEDAREMQREKAQGPKEQIIGQMLDRTPEASPVKKVETKVNVISSNLIKRKRPLEEAAGSGGAAGSSSAAAGPEKKAKEDEAAGSSA